MFVVMSFFGNGLIPHVTPVKPLCAGRLKHVRDAVEPSPKGHLTLTFWGYNPHFLAGDKLEKYLSFLFSLSHFFSLH